MKVLGMKVDPKVLLVLVETRSALDRAEEWCRMYDAETKTGARCVALDRHASRWSAEGRLKLVAHTIFPHGSEEASRAYYLARCALTNSHGTLSHEHIYINRELGRVAICGYFDRAIARLQAP
jgi:hypothetical protein